MTTSSYLLRTNSCAYCPRSPHPRLQNMHLPHMLDLLQLLLACKEGAKNFLSRFSPPNLRYLHYILLACFLFRSIRNGFWATVQLLLLQPQTLKMRKLALKYRCLRLSKSSRLHRRIYSSFSPSRFRGLSTLLSSQTLPLL